MPGSDEPDGVDGAPGAEPVPEGVPEPVVEGTGAPAVPLEPFVPPGELDSLPELLGAPCSDPLLSEPLVL